MADQSKRRSGGSRRSGAADEGENATTTEAEAAEQETTPGPGAPDDTVLAGEDLDKRASQLNIEGRSDMSADEKRAAIARAENAERAQAAGGPGSPDDRQARAASDVPQDHPYPKDVLIARSVNLLGVSPVVARGVLADADETITVADALARIDAFNTTPVQPTEEA